MGERLCSGLLHRESEFALVDGTRLYGACGPCALASAASNVRGSIVHTADVYELMRSAGLCDPSGASTINGLETASGKLDLPVAAFRGYGEPWTEWQAFFNTHAGIRPIVIELANGQALVDAISGDGENAANLHYHFITILGRNDGGWSPRANRNLPAGYWCADGDNFAGGNSNANNFNAADVLQFYPDSVMAAAQPCAALALVKAQTGGSGVSVPTGWHDDGSTLTAPNGHKVVQGFRDHILSSNWNAENLPLEEEHGQDPMELGNPSIAPGSQQIFRWTVLEWNSASGVFEMWTGQELGATREALAKEQGAVASLTTQLNTAQGDLAAAQKQIANLQAQIAQLKSQPADNPAADAALAALKQLRSAMGL